MSQFILPLPLGIVTEALAVRDEARSEPQGEFRHLERIWKGYSKDKPFLLYFLYFFLRMTSEKFVPLWVYSEKETLQ